MFPSRKNRTSRSVSHAARQDRPTFEMLEERQHFSVYTVTNTNDSGTGSLRAAIQAVNAGKDSVIDFNIPKSSSGYAGWNKTWTITPLSPLPVLQKTVMIDGYSQPSYNGSPVVYLNIEGLEFAAPHSTLRGLYIENAAKAVTLDSTSSADVIVGNTIAACLNEGVRINSSNNIIGAVGHPNLILNMLHGNALEVYGNGNKIIRNTVTNADKTMVIVGEANIVQGNTVSESWDGPAISVEGLNNSIGGLSSGDGNVVSGESVGIDPGSDSNTVLGNTVSVLPAGEGIVQDESQAAPVINSAEEYLGKLTVSGTVNSTPHSQVRVELFASTPQYNNEQGQVFLGYVNVTTNGSGTATFSDTVAYDQGGKVITATATAGGNSSGFSNALAEFVKLPIVRPIRLI